MKSLAAAIARAAAGRERFAAAARGRGRAGKPRVKRGEAQQRLARLIEQALRVGLPPQGDLIACSAHTWRWAQA